MPDLSTGPVPYACWGKEVQIGKLVHQRRYVLRLDGTIIQRLDVRDVDRWWDTAGTEGWQEFRAAAGPGMDTASLEKLIQDDLTPKGYARLF